RVAQNVRSMGVALSACTVPHAGKPSFDLSPQEIELGIGIHGEPGRERVPAAGANEITERLLAAVTDDLTIADGDQVVLLVNGMRGTPLSELYIVSVYVGKVLEARGASVACSLGSDYVTFLEMQACSISVLPVEEKLLELSVAPVVTSA